MGFDSKTLLSLPFGLLIPGAIIAFMVLKKTKIKKAYDSVLMGFGAFLASVAAVAVVFFVVNMLFLSNITFNDETSGLSLVGTIITIMILTVYIVCESFKSHIIKTTVNGDTPKVFSSLGFSAGVVIAQNAIVFVINNLISGLTAASMIFYGVILLFTGIMYTALSAACEVMIKEDYIKPAFALSSVYYIFWAAVVICVNSSVLLYVSSIAIFVISIVLSSVFIFKFSKKSGDLK